MIIEEQVSNRKNVDEYEVPGQLLPKQFELFIDPDGTIVITLFSEDLLQIFCKMI